MLFALKDAIPKALLENIRSSITDELLINNSSALGRYNRMGRSLDVSKISELSLLDAQICEFITSLANNYIHTRFRPMFASGDSGYQFHRYEPGDMCLLHADGECSFNEGGNTGFLRYATVVLHLNTVAVGGETVFPNQNKSFPTIEGQILIFPPHGGYQHYVTPSLERRDILMTWMVYSGITVNK